jgi:plasmid maintenance system antidote protein VapI
MGVSPWGSTLQLDEIKTDPERNERLLAEYKAGRKERLSKKTPSGSEPETVFEPITPRERETHAGEDLEDLMQGAGISAKELAKRLDVSFDTVERLYAGVTHPTISIIVAALQLLPSDPERDERLLNAYRAEKAAVNKRADQKRKDQQRHQ